MVGHQSVEALIRSDEAIKSGMFRSIATFIEGYGEGLWVFAV